MFTNLLTFGEKIAIVTPYLYLDNKNRYILYNTGLIFIISVWPIIMFVV